MKTIIRLPNGLESASTCEFECANACLWLQYNQLIVSPSEYNQRMKIDKICPEIEEYYLIYCESNQEFGQICLGQEPHQEMSVQEKIILLIYIWVRDTQ